MANWVDLAALHDPSPGTRPPAAWGDGVNSNLAFLAGTAVAEVVTSQATTSVTFTDLSTVGPSVSVNTGTSALVIVSASVENSAADQGGALSFTVTGASSIAATTPSANETAALCSAPAKQQSACALFLVSLTAGINVFTMKYRAHWGGTASFINRRIAVIPLRS